MLKPGGSVFGVKVFHGWIILAAATVTYFLAGGIRFGVFGVFLKPITEQFGWSRSAVSGAASLGSMQGAIEGLVVGGLADKYGPRIVMWGGFVLATAGFILLFFVDSLWLFYLAFVPLISLGTGTVQLPGQATVGKWFIRKRSRAFAILTTGFALGGAALTPLIGWLVSNYGWRNAALVMGFTVCAVGMAVTTFMHRSPEQYGLQPDGGPAAPAAANVKRPVREQAKEVDFTLRQALATKSFWLLGMGLMLSNLAVSSMAIHSIPLLTDKGMAAQTAANYIGLASLWGMAGRLLWGWLGDFLSKRRLLAIAVIVQGLGIFALAHATSTPQIHLYAFLYGVGQGIVPVQFAVRGEYFGRKSLGAISGTMQAFGTVGGVIGPVYAGWAYDTTRSYTTALTILAVASLVGFIAYFFAQRPVPSTTKMTP